MPDKSIYTSDSDYDSVVTKIYEQKQSGVTDQEIYNKLIEEYKPGHISLLLHYYNRIPSIKEKVKLNYFLIGALWLILFAKILIVPNYLIYLELPFIWKSIIYVGNLIIPGACLYFSYNHLRYPAITIFSLVALQLLMGYRSILEIILLILRRIDISSDLVFSVVFVLASVAALLLSRKLSVLFPAQSVKLFRTVYRIDRKKAAEEQAQRTELF